METLLALVLSNISKFLNYLNINVRLQNKIMTIVSVFPTLYILRIVKGYFSNQNYIKGVIYLLIFIVLFYFIVVNFIYYFKNRKVKWDVTNFIEDIVPEDATFGETTSIFGKEAQKKSSIQGISVPLSFFDDSSITIEQVITALIKDGKIKVQDLSTHTYLIKKYTLIPFYKIRNQTLFIGSSYSDMEEVAHINDIEEADDLVPLGVFILGGTHQVGGITYKEPYSIELRVKDESSEEATCDESLSRVEKKQKKS